MTKWGTNANGEYVGPLKRVHSRSVHGTVMLQRLKNGSLDADLKTGEILGFNGQVMAGRYDEDGYQKVELSLACKRGGRKERDGRRRQRQSAFSHRIVMMKKKAIEAAGDEWAEWRKFVKELPKGVDVNHDDGDRANNAADNLSLQTEAANRGKREMTPEEQAAIDDFYDS